MSDQSAPQEVSDDEVAALRKYVDELNGTLREEKRSAVAVVRGSENTVRATALLAEAQSLEAQIAAVRGIEAPPADPGVYEVPMGTITTEGEVVTDASQIETLAGTEAASPPVAPTPPPPPPPPVAPAASTSAVDSDDTDPQE